MVPVTLPNYPPKCVFSKSAGGVRNIALYLAVEISHACSLVLVGTPILCYTRNMECTQVNSTPAT